MGIARTAAAIALLLAPTGVVVGANLTDTGKAVEQHTSYVQIVVDGGEPRSAGYAAVAGLVTCQAANAVDDAVRWFDDQILFREGNRGPDTRCLDQQNMTHVWATQEGAPDPRDNPTLAPTGNAFEFTDPNNRYWNVREYSYQVLETLDGTRVNLSTDAALPVTGDGVENATGNTTALAGNLTDAVDADGIAADALEGAGVEASQELDLRTARYHAWVVEIKQPTLDPTIAEHYNFVSVVDFSKLAFGPDGQAEHTGDGPAKDGASHEASTPEDEKRLPHDHGTADGEVRVGPAPSVDAAALDGLLDANVTVLTPAMVDQAGVEIGDDRLGATN